MLGWSAMMTLGLGCITLRIDSADAHDAGFSDAHGLDSCGPHPADAHTQCSGFAWVQ